MSTHRNSFENEEVTSKLQCPSTTCDQHLVEHPLESSVPKKMSEPLVQALKHDFDDLSNEPTCSTSYN